MKWIIKNPAPDNQDLMNWGDYHFGRNLTRFLECKGQEVITQYAGNWDSDETSDVVLLLRGLYGHKRTESNKNAYHMMWNISHPERISFDEYQGYDLVMIASNKLSNELQKKMTAKVIPLLQCTNTEECYPRDLPEGEQRRGFVFVGNSRMVYRDGILWALEYGFPVKVYGQHWGGYIDKKHWETDYFPQQKLGELYSQSRLTFNDHWQDMIDYGFINDRNFDALACGCPVISDYHEELYNLFPEAIVYYRNKDELIECLETSLLSYPRLLAAAADAAKLIKDEYSFEQRAETMIELAQEGSKYKKPI